MSRDDTGIIRAGMAIVISNGCYSDYSFGQVYIAVKDFNYMEEAKKYYMLNLDKQFSAYGRDMWFRSNSDKFENYLVNNGFLALCDYREIHTGDYDFFDEYIWREEWKKKNNWDVTE